MVNAVRSTDTFGSLTITEVVLPASTMSGSEARLSRRLKGRFRTHTLILSSLDGLPDALTLGLMSPLTLLGTP